MLLRNVLAAFLDDLPSERALDLPLLALLADMGFKDVHFTHGIAEFGKDFIAKRTVDGELVQYAFQSKAGDVNQGSWRSEVMPQMLEAVVSGLSHPSFDKSLPQQGVLVLSGRLVGNAPIGLQDLNETIRQKYGKRPVDVWDRERLIEYLIEFGPDSFYAADGHGVQSFGAFFVAYGRALQGNLLEGDIEPYSRVWVLGSESSAPKLLEGALEAELLANACVRAKRPYETQLCILAHLRSVLVALHGRESSPNDLVRQLYAAGLLRLRELSATYIRDFAALVDHNGGDFFEAVGGAKIVTYPVECCRALEIAALLYFIGTDEQRSASEKFLLDVVKEPGCWHPISDRAAVSLVLGALALVGGGHSLVARDLVHRAVVWVADRYERGMGLAEFDASPTHEVNLLLGFPFEGLSIETRGDSLLATALCDLAAFLADETLYADVVNEFGAVEIAFNYFQTPDTIDQFHIDGAGVVQYPNVEYESSLSAFTEGRYATHISSEPRTFRLANQLGPTPYAALMLLLRDRYFPFIWPVLAPPQP
jgi:hypothetical protein